MTFQGDPFRVLGVTPGASLNEIRSAYRRLAKKYHPDTAGERAVTRFLAIQAAYEQLVDADGRLRPSQAEGSPGAAGRPGREPWRADPARARASRDAWRARRAGQARPGGAATGGAATGATATGGPRTGTGGAATGGSRTETGAGRGTETGTGHRTGTRAEAGARPRDEAGSGPRASGDGRGSEHTSRRGPRKATPGSTTYDDAADGSREPEWDGGAWYGPSSRTYWTINPREYADPRKHGPEYQERARRAASWSGLDAAGAGPAPSTTDADDQGPSGWGGGSWTYRSDPATGGAGPDVVGPDARTGARGTGPEAGAGAPPEGRPSAARSMPGTGNAADPPPLPDLESLARQAAPRHLLALARRPDRRWRWLLALIGWPPVGWAVGTLLTTLTGCAGFSATCPAPVPVLSILIQPFVVAGLVLVPPLAALAAFGSIAAITAAVPLAAVLAVGTAPGSRVGAAVLGALIGATYLVALVAGGYSLWQSPSGPEVDGPASR